MGGQGLKLGGEGKRGEHSGMGFRVILEPLVAPWVQGEGRGHRRCFWAGLTERIVAGGEQGWGMVS